MKMIWSIFVFFVGFQVSGCSQKEVRVKPLSWQEKEVLVEGLLEPRAVNEYWTRRYFIVEGASPVAGAQGGRLVMVHNEKKETLFSDLSTPRGVTSDHRRALVFVADGLDLKAFPFKKKETLAFSISAPGEKNLESGKTRYLEDLDYSLMNRKVYATDPIGRSVWAFDTKNKKVSQVVGPEFFERMNLGAPLHVFSSVDGSKLFLSTVREENEAGVKPVALLEVRLSDQKGNILWKDETWTRVGGLHVYREHLVFFEEAASNFYALRLEEGSKPSLIEGAKFRGEFVDFEGDDNYAIVLSKENAKGVLQKFLMKVTY